MVIANFWWIVGAFAVGYIISGIIYRMGQGKRDTYIIETTVAQTKEAMSALFIQRLHELGYDVEEMKRREMKFALKAAALDDGVDWPDDDDKDKASFGFDLTPKK